MISKNQKKLIASMAQKKQRDTHNLFLAEGSKTIEELLSEGLQAKLVLATEEWKISSKLQKNISSIEIISKEELIIISHLVTPQTVLGLFYKPDHNVKNNAIYEQLVLVLDGIQDPGNLGTIVRLADWFGIREIICSMDSADIYNPKVVQATMGAIARVKVHYTELSDFLENYKNNCSNPIYGTFLNGTNIYSEKLSDKGLIIMGNEGRGIRLETESYITKKLTIPSFTGASATSESLNVGVATAIICSEFKRRTV